MAKGDPMRYAGPGSGAGLNPAGSLGPSARQSSAPQTSPPPLAGASPRASVVVQGMLAFSSGSKRELWCTEAATTVTVRRADHVQLEVSGQIALSSKAMPPSTTALCLCLVEQSLAPTAPGGAVDSTAGGTSARNQSAPSYEVWTSWTSGHVVIIDAVSRDPVEYVRWDPPHPIHSFVYLPPLAPGLGGSGAVGPGLVVGIALDGCLSIWDVSDRRVVASLAVTVGSKCPLTAVVGTNSTGTAAGHYVYCGFDDGSIRCFLVRTQLLAGPVNAPRRYKATMEVAESRCLYDVHRGSVLSLIASQGPKQGPGPSAVGGAPAGKVVLTLWSGGEDGTLRKTTFAGVSSAVKSTIILQSGSTAAAGGTTAANPANYFHKLCLCGHHLVACSNDGSVSILSAVGDHALLQRVQFQQPLCVREIASLPLNHMERMSEDGEGTSAARSSVRRVVLSLSDGSLRNVALRLSEGEMEEVMELDRMRDVAVSPAAPDRSRGLVSPTGGQQHEYGSPPVSVQQQIAPVRAGTSNANQARNLATGFSPEERPRAASPPMRSAGTMNWQQTATDRSYHNSRDSHHQSQSGGLQVRHGGALQLVDPEDDAFLSDEERLMMQEEQTRLKEQQRPKTPPPQELIQVVLKIMFELRKTEDEETAKRVDMWKDFVAKLDYIRDVMNFTFWRPFIGGFGISGIGGGGASPSRSSEVVATASRALMGTILAEKISIEADFVRQRDEMRQQFWRTQRTLFKLSTIIPELKLHRQIILDAEREEFLLLQHLHGHMRRTMPLLASPQLISELRREVADLNVDVAARDKELEQLKEVEKQLEKVTHERDRTQKLLADLQSLVQEQRQAVHSSNEETVYLVQEHRRVLLNGVQQQEVVNRRTIVSHWEEFWREHIFTQLHRLQSLQMEGVGIEMQVAKSGSMKHANEVAALRQVIGDLERKLRAVELKLSAAEHHVSKAEHEKAAFADEAAAYRLRLAHSEAELQAVRDRQGSSTTETMLIEQRLATTLALAEESCQTVVEQQGIIAQLNGRLQTRQAAVAELLSLLESQLMSGVEPAWLSEARSLLRDVMYDLAAARRGSGGSGGVAGDYNRAVSPRRHADPSAAMELLGPSHTTLEKLSQAFEKVKQSLERCLEPGSHRHLHLERVSLSDLVRRVQTEMELPSTSSFTRSMSVATQRRDAIASISSTSPRPGPVSPPATR